MPTLVDLSHPLSDGTEAYPGDPSYRASTVHQHADHGYLVSEVQTCTHIGTHVDAPLHVLPGGASVDQIPLDHLVGDAIVVDVPLSDDSTIGLDAVEHELRPGARILVRTGWSARFGDDSYHRAFPQVDEALAQAAADAGVWLLGLEQPSVHRDHETGLRVHQVLLRAGCIIVEGLDLSRLRAGTVHVSCLPMPLRGLDGAPVRAVAVVPD